VRNEMYGHKYRFCWNRQSFTHTSHYQCIFHMKTQVFWWCN
jgi:hypothetical protein